MTEPSLHVAPLISCLAAHSGREVSVVLEEDLSASRRRLGWSEVTHGDAVVQTPRSTADREQVERSFGPEWTHLFWGLGVYPATAQSMVQIRRKNPTSRIGVFSEPWNPQGFRGLLRRHKYRAKYQRFGGIPDFVLAAGDLARREFIELGFGPAQVFPFAYFVDPSRQSVSGDSEVQGDRDVELLFVGQLVDRKGPLVLMDALADLRELRWRLTIAGDGRLADEVSNRARELGLGRRVRMLGAVPSAGVPRLMASSDALIVPSRFDGWGAVVNEALVQGTPCLVARTVGAEVLISSTRGSVFDTDAELAHQLERVINEGGG